MHSKQQNDVNHPSILLNPNQNAVVFSLLGKKCYTLATAVVQLVLTDPSSLNKWSIKTTGVACFVKDHPRRSYFIKVYDCDKRTLTWQQEVYTAFEYRSPRPYFHTFEAHDCIVGLNFASEQEAEQFKEAILGKLKDRVKKKIEKSQSSLIGNLNNNMILTNNVTMSDLGKLKDREKKKMEKSQSSQLGNLNNNMIFTNSVTKSDKKKLNKRDIGLPINFQHVTHVGFSPQTGFDLENVNPSMKKDLQKLFADADQQQSQPLPPTPSQSTPQLPAHQQQSHQVHHHYPAPPPPPVPPMTSPAVLNKSKAQSNGNYHSSDSREPRAMLVVASGPTLHPPPVPPPPPPPRPLPPMPSRGNSSRSPRQPAQTSNNNLQQSMQHIEKSPITNGLNPLGAPAPPPPPPPPPPGVLVNGSNTPKVARAAPNNNLTTSNMPEPPPGPRNHLDMHAALMSQLLKGKQLNHVDPSTDRRSQLTSTVTNGQDNPRTALMNQIKAGVKLKTVSSTASKPATNPQPAAAGLAGALAKALQERSKVLQQTDESQSSSGDDADDDDEWDES